MFAASIPPMFTRLEIPLGVLKQWSFSRGIFGCHQFGRFAWTLYSGNTCLSQRGLAYCDCSVVSFKG